MDSMTDKEVLELVRQKGLPHLHCRAYQPEEAKPAWPEEPESEDPLTMHGMDIGKSHGGRRGLEDRLRVGAAGQP